MDITYEVKGVEIVPFPTVAAALLAGLGKDYLQRPAPSFFEGLLSKRRGRKEEQLQRELAWRKEQLNRPLSGAHEVLEPYQKTLALVSVGREIGVHAFYEALTAEKYYPANLNEGMAYLQCMAGVDIETVFHLGKRFLDDALLERRLLTRRSDGFEFVPYYPRMTKLKPFYHVVVVKEEKPK